MMADREQLIEVFHDTEIWWETSRKLSDSVKRSVSQTKLYREDEYPALPATEVPLTEISVTASRSFEAAIRLRKEFPSEKIAVHNFASATNPGGGVTKGSRAQEECLCRCSTLYPVLSSEYLYREFYQFHRARGDVRYTDACIYTPDILIIKSDEDLPQRLPEDQWCTVDVITCAAPNLRAKPYNRMNPGTGSAVSVTDEELLAIHKKRARHMLTVAAANGARVLVLGAFGCGAFQNNPEIVAQAYKDIMPEFERYFRKIEFAVYCTPRDQKNYQVFRRILGEGGMEDPYGISVRVLNEIRSLAEKYGIGKVILFGSRARGDFKRTSDIDLAVSGGNISAFALAVDEETYTLLKYDVVNLDGSVQEELRESIAREGKLLYEKV